ncbi:hypothetical protein CDD81_4977 [Ophiocordyceps australis]|uniref:Uncharacterized protein n=1 Tax=Ophiocordyceps australis TaxID=1399860 RepID=A0A2C5YA23_9HYPO|nr:hypothetical protein CDD81_4977 [Ophiocordyceps australis]
MQPPTTRRPGLVSAMTAVQIKASRIMAAGYSQMQHALATPLRSQMAQATLDAGVGRGAVGQMIAKSRHVDAAGGCSDTANEPTLSTSTAASRRSDLPQGLSRHVEQPRGVGAAVE